MPTPHHSRRLPDREFRNAVTASLESLSALAEGFDRGVFGTAREMAVICHRLFVDEIKYVVRRRDLLVVDLAYPISENNIMKQSTCANTQVRIHGVAPEITVEIAYVPAFLDALPGSVHREVRFADWWNAHVLISGASHSVYIPKDLAKQIPFSQRRKWSRRQVVEHVRNKMGAHFDPMNDEDASLLRDPLFAENISIDCDGIVVDLQTSPDIFIFLNHPLHAIVRHVVEELMRSVPSQIGETATAN